MNGNPGNTVLDPAPEVNETLGFLFAFFVSFFSYIKSFFAGFNSIGNAPENGAAE